MVMISMDAKVKYIFKEEAEQNEPNSISNILKYSICENSFFLKMINKSNAEPDERILRNDEKLSTTNNPENSNLFGVKNTETEAESESIKPAINT